MFAGSQSDKLDQPISLKGYNPFIEGVDIYWDGSQVALKLYDDVQGVRLQESDTEEGQNKKDKANQFVINEIARISRLTDEMFKPSDDSFVLNLDALSNSQSYLTLNLGYLAEKRVKQIEDQILLSWVQEHTDLLREAYPVRTYEEYKKAPIEKQKLGLVFYAPAIYPLQPPSGFRNQSIYVIAKGMDVLLQHYRESPDSPESQVLVKDFNALNTLLTEMGFIGYSGASFDLPQEFSKDYIFELNDYYSTLLKATREDFTVKGSKRYAVLDFSDVEQRILAINTIEDRMQEDLLKWKESYHAAQVDLNVPANKHTVPAPTKNVYWENFKLSFFKYFHGDDRKVLKWGSRPSGGKTVRIALFDQNNRPVPNPEDLSQAVNELYNRINKWALLNGQSA